MRENWKYSTIGESCNINYGTRVVRKRDGGTIYDVYGGGGATFKMDTYNRENCLVVSRFAMSPKCTRFVSGKFFLNDSGLTLSPKEDSGLSEVFMNTILLANNDNIYEYGRGSAQRNLKVDEFCTMPISYPKSLTEQERIVALLDDQFAKIDALKANAAFQLQAAKDLFQSALKEMLTPKEGWEKKKIYEIADVKGGKRVPRGYKFESNKTKHIYIRVSDFDDNGTISCNDLQYISDDVYEKIKRYTITSDDMYISIAGTIGKAGIIPERLNGANLTENACKLVLKGNVYKFYLYYITLSPNFKEEIKRATKIGSQPKLALTRLEQIPISFPSLPEQERIAARLDAISEKVKALQANYDQTINLCNDLKQSLLKSIFE